jgi:hypothetical protein
MDASPSQGQVMDIVPSDTIRFDIPVHSQSDRSLEQTVHQLSGMEPTHCLAVRPRPKPFGEKRPSYGDSESTLQSETEAVGRMIPIQ